MQGVQGIQGTQGIQGIRGIDGIQGPQGLQGPSGGPTGPTGPGSGSIVADLNMNSYSITNTNNVTVKNVYSAIPGSYLTVVTSAPTSNWSGAAAGLSPYGYSVPYMACVNGGFMYSVDSNGVATARTAVNQNWTAIANTYYGTTYACVNGGQVWTTTNGTSWTVLSASPTAAYTCLSVLYNTPASILAGTSTGALYFSADTGATWTTIASLASAVTSVLMAAGTFFYATTGGSTGQIWKSTNTGVSWTAASATQRDWTCLTMRNVNNVWAASSTDPVYYTSNAGSTWANISVTADKIVCVAQLFNVLFASKNGGYTFTSTDAGVTWTQTSTITGSWSCIGATNYFNSAGSVGYGYSVLYGASTSAPYQSYYTTDALRITSQEDIYISPGQPTNYGTGGSVVLGGKTFITGYDGTSQRVYLSLFGTANGAATSTGSVIVTLPTSYNSSGGYAPAVTPRDFAGASVCVSNTSGTQFVISWINGSAVSSNIFRWITVGY